MNDVDAIGRSSKGAIAVCGASGFFGTLAIEDLLRSTGCDILAITRRRPFSAASPRVRTAVADVADAGQMRRVLTDDVRVIVNCAGPFHGMPSPLPRICIERGMHYVDIAETPSHLRHIAALHPAAVRAGVSLIPGCSVFPGLLAALLPPSIRAASQSTVTLFLDLGESSPRGSATVASLLNAVGDHRGSPFLRLRLKRIASFARRRIFFEYPLGADVGADFPRGARVRMFAATVFPPINLLFSLLPALRIFVARPDRLAPFLAFGQRLTPTVVQRGGIGVTFRAGTIGGGMAITAEEGCPRIVIVPACIVAQKIVLGISLPPGVVAFRDCLAEGDLVREFARRKIDIVLDRSPNFAMLPS